jgi:hypothetical protein
MMRVDAILAVFLGTTLVHTKGAAVDQRVTLRAPIAEENGDLPVLDSSGRVAVLPRNPHGMAARLQEDGLVQNQDAGWIAEMLDHIIRRTSRAFP